MGTAFGVYSKPQSPEGFMQKSYFLLMIVFLLAPSLSLAGDFWSEFGRGFSETTNKTMERKAEEREFQNSHDAAYDTMVSELQERQNRQAHIEQIQFDNAMRQLKLDVARCNKVAATRKTILKIINCESRAMKQRFAQGEYPYMELLKAYLDIGTQTAKLYAQGKISKSQYHAKMADLGKSFNDNEIILTKHNRQREEVDIAAIANLEASKFALNQKKERAESKKRQKELDEIRDEIRMRVGNAEWSAQKAKIEAEEARSRESYWRNEAQQRNRR